MNPNETTTESTNRRLRGVANALRASANALRETADELESDRG